MASVRKRGNSYQITVSNGRNIYGKQLIETATFVPDPNRTERQNQKALEKFVFEFEEKGFTKNGVHKNYKPNTLKRIHQIISSSLNTAVQWQLIESNPCCRVKPPKVVKNPAALKHFTLEQAQVFLDFLDEPYLPSEK